MFSIIEISAQIESLECQLASIEKIVQKKAPKNESFYGAIYLHKAYFYASVCDKNYSCKYKPKYSNIDCDNITHGVDVSDEQKKYCEIVQEFLIKINSEREFKYEI